MANGAGITAVTTVTGGAVAAGPMIAGTENAAGVIIMVTGTMIARVGVNIDAPRAYRLMRSSWSTTSIATAGAPVPGRVFSSHF